MHVEPEVRGGGGCGGGERHGDKYQLELQGAKLAFGHGVIRETRTKGLHGAKLGFGLVSWSSYLNRGTQHVLI